MDHISDIVTIKEITTALFHTNDRAEVNMLQRAIYSEIETYAIDIVIFHVNTSSRHDEIIALQLGQLVIDHTRFVPPEDGNFKSSIDFDGPGAFTTDNIPELPFKYKTPIAYLRAGQKIKCEIIIKLGTGRQHVKWRPLSTFTFKEHEMGYSIRVKGIGMLPGVDIIQKGLDKIDTASSRPGSNIFSRPVVPNNFVQ